MARQETINFQEFQEKFNTEEACREYLFELRWTNGYECPKCGYKEYYLISTRNKYQCKSCRYQACSKISARISSIRFGFRHISLAAHYYRKRKGFCFRNLSRPWAKASAKLFG